MINAYFYKYSKRENSTARPADNAGLMYKIALKENTNVDAPDIILYVGRATIPEFNYVFIPDLERYFFIDTWTYIDHANWMASCTIDVLATYKYDIGEQTLYVVRSASRSDGNIPDMLYPATNDVTTQSLITESPWMYHDDVTINQGCFVIGCDSKNGNYGSINYYVVTQAALQDICRYLTTDFVSLDNLFNDTDASIALQNSIVNPLQYIKSCMWFPFSKTELTSITQQNQNVMIYDQYIREQDDGGVWHYTQGDKLTQISTYKPNTITLSKLSHPQANDHGNYMNGMPFTNVSLKLPPFGVIELDATVINKTSGLYIDMYADLITGKLVAEVKAGVNTLNRVSTQLGVPIQLSQVTRNYLGAVTSAAGAVSSVFNMDFLGAVNGIGNAIQNAAPRVNSIGSNGGFADMYGDIELMYTFYMQTEINNFYHGKPLMKTVQLGTLSGYMEVESADVVIECTSEERARIINYLQQGFYYE